MSKKIKQVLAGSVAAASLVVFGTIAHQGQLGGFPYGLTLSLGAVLLTAMQFRRKRLANWTQTIVLAAGLLWVGQSFHQDIMIPANLYGYIWGYGAIGISALVAMWPRIRN